MLSRETLPKKIFKRGIFTLVSLAAFLSLSSGVYAGSDGWFYFDVNSTHANFNFTVGNWSQNFTLSTSITPRYQNGTATTEGIAGVILTYYLPYGIRPAAPSNCNSSLLYYENLTNATTCAANLGTVGPGAVSHTLLVNLTAGAFPKYWPNALNITINASNGSVSALNSVNVQGYNYSGVAISAANVSSSIFAQGANVSALYISRVEAGVTLANGSSLTLIYYGGSSNATGNITYTYDGTLQGWQNGTNFTSSLSAGGFRINMTTRSTATAPDTIYIGIESGTITNILSGTVSDAGITVNYSSNSMVNLTAPSARVGYANSSGAGTLTSLSVNFTLPINLSAVYSGQLNESKIATIQYSNIYGFNLTEIIVSGSLNGTAFNGSLSTTLIYIDVNVTDGPAYANITRGRLENGTVTGTYSPTTAQLNVTRTMTNLTGTEARIYRHGTVDASLTPVDYNITISIPVNLTRINVSGRQITSTGGIGNVTRDHYALNFWVNPRPGIKDYYQNYDNSNSSVIFTYWNQTDPVYQMMTPLMSYNTTTNRTQLSNGTFSDVLYFGGKEMVERPSWMRLWGYNLTFKLLFNGSGIASYWIYTPVNNTNFPEQTLFPIFLSTRNVTNPMDNTTFSMTIGVPDQNAFSVWYNGTQYTAAALSQTENVNISFVPGNQNLYAIQVNATNSTANNTQISMLFTMMNYTTFGNGTPMGNPLPVSPIYVDFQNITGFQPTSPPKLGENITTTYLINVSNKLRNYTLNYLKLHFFMPINVTINDLGANTNTTYRLTQGANLSWKVYNGDDVWHDAGITSANKSVQVTDNMPGSPSTGDNVTIWFTSYDITLDSAFFNNWLPNFGNMSNVSMNFTSTMSFPPLNESTPPTVTTGGSYQYNVSVSMSMQAGLNLTAKVPGLNASATNIQVLVDGSALTNGTNYTVGSLTVDSVSSGSHSVSVSYSVAAGAPTPVTSSAAAAEAAVSGGAAPAPVSKVDITSTTTADIITSFGYQNREVYIAPSMMFGVLGALDAFPTTLEEKKSIESILYSGVKSLEGDVYTIAKERVLAKYSKTESVIIARGDLGLDALASTAYARALGVPILLVEPQKAPQVTLDALTTLGTKSVTIVGGPVAVSEEVKAKLPSPTRIAGANRHETAVKIAEALMAKISVNSIVITDSNNPDPKAVLMAAYYKAPIVYVEGDKVPAATEVFIKGNKDKFTKAVRYAGISAGAKTKVEALLS